MTVSMVADLLPDVDATQASYHLAQLHANAPGFASLSLLGNGRRERHGFTAITELTGLSEHATIVSSVIALQEVVDERWNVYTACSTFAAVPERGRGTRADVASVPGVWADLDVKPGVEGYFQTEAECQAYLDELLTPTLTIGSGSGGRHAYWLVHPDQRLDATNGQRLLLRWLDHLRAEAQGAVIENVHDTTRILRLAGTVRWPKDGADVVSMPRKVQILAAGPRYHVGELNDLATVAHETARAARDEARRARGEVEQRRRELLGERGLPLEILDHTVRRFNVLQDWAALLEPTGWTLFADVRDGAARCRYWTRPGKSVADGKSASTDYVSDDGVVANKMTIYTNDTALHDLWENAGQGDAHGLCSKYFYALKRLFDGSDEDLLRAIASGGGVLP